MECQVRLVEKNKYYILQINKHKSNDWDTHKGTNSKKCGTFSFKLGSNPRLDLVN